MMIAVKSGRQVDVFSLRPQDLDIRDIAWSLAHQNRFSGHGGVCSVAEHSVLVASMVSEENEKYALLHDAAEAFVGDLATPIKKMCPDFNWLEAQVFAVIADRFEIDIAMPEEVHAADKAVCVTEAEQLFGVDWSEEIGYAPAPVGLNQWEPVEAYRHFLSYFESLFGPISNYTYAE